MLYYYITNITIITCYVIALAYNLSSFQIN